MRELVAAIENDDLVLHYQPKVAIDTGRVIGAEALVRWKADEGHLIAPSEFIPSAERDGSIFPLDRWVLRRACTDLATWDAQGFGRGKHVCVNVSSNHLREPCMVEDVEQALASAGLDPDRIVIEVTERAALVYDSQTRSNLAALHERGVRIAIDDFGTGYSSMSDIRRFPQLDFLKIDRLFVSGLGSDVRDTAVTAACVRLAHALGATPVAEGVETSAQLAEIRALGCELAQGFYLSRPGPASKIGPLLVTNLIAGKAAELG